jgi:hypothetical protein
MNNASIDVDARRTFREELRGRRVALRSFIPRDDIDDVEIVQAEDPEVSATRQVLKVEAVERTGEIDALDVLESIEIIQECARSAVVVPTAVTETAPLPAIVERAPHAALDVEDDAFFAHNDSPSTGPVTFHLGDCYVDEVGPTIELHGASNHPSTRGDRRQRLAWIVGTVIACAVVMTAAAAITSQTQASSSEVVASSAATPAATTAAAATAAPAATVVVTPAAAAGPSSSSTFATKTAYPAIPEMEVASLPAALAGTIVGIPKRPLFVDGKRLQSSTAIVACGKHTVRSGAFRPAHLIDVPCGGSIALK